MTRRTTLIFAAVLLIPTLVYAYAGRFSRLMADDYCYAVNLRAYGFPGFITYYYDNWFGRITQTVGAAVGSALGVGFAEIFPALLLALWLVGLLWLCRELAGLLHWERPTVYIGAALLLYATLGGTPQIFHSLYWISAVFPFTVPLVLLTFYLALALRVLRLGSAPPLTILASVVLALVAGLTCEPFAVAFVGGIAAGIVGVFYFRPRPDIRRAALTFLIPGLITAVVALVIMVAAPGNTLRQGLFPPTHDPIRLITQSLLYTAAFTVASILYFSPGAVGLALLVPAIIAYQHSPVEISRGKLRLWIGLTALVGLGLIALINVPAIYATSAPPPARVLIIPQFVLIGSLAVIGYLIGLHLRKGRWRINRLIVAVVIGLLVGVGPLLSAWNMIALTPKLSTYASEWDAQEAQIVAAAQAGQQDVTVAPLSIDLAQLTGLDTINEQGCAATYYGVQSLRTTS